MRVHRLFLSCLLAVPLAGQQATPLGYFRFPAISGDQVVFTAEGDSVLGPPVTWSNSSPGVALEFSGRESLAEP